MNSLKNYVYDESVVGSNINPIAAYITLITSLLNEPFVSSFTKYSVISGSYTKLKELGYTVDEINSFKEKMSVFINTTLYTRNIR